MEPSPSLDATIVLRTAQGESHFGARVVIDRVPGDAVGSHRCPLRVDAPPAALRVRSRAAGCSMPRPKGGSASTACRSPAPGSIIAGDVITIAGTQLLVEEASRGRCPAAFELEGNDTLPPVGDSVRTRWRPPRSDRRARRGPQRRRLRAGAGARQPRAAR
jgi:hypothetical protein